MCIVGVSKTKRPSILILVPERRYMKVMYCCSKNVALWATVVGFVLLVIEGKCKSGSVILHVVSSVNEAWPSLSFALCQYFIVEPCLVSIGCFKCTISVWVIDMIIFFWSGWSLRVYVWWELTFLEQRKIRFFFPPKLNQRSSNMYRQLGIVWLRSHGWRNGQRHELCSSSYNLLLLHTEDQGFFPEPAKAEFGQLTCVLSHSDPVVWSKCETFLSNIF